MVIKGQGLVGVAVLVLLLMAVGTAIAGGTEGGIPLGAQPVDMALMDGGRIVVLMETATEWAMGRLAGEGIPDAAASLLFLRVQGDGRVLLEGEVVLHKEAATRSEKTHVRGFDILIEGLTAEDPSHLVVAGHESDQMDRVFVISHRFEGVFDVDVPNLLARRPDELSTEDQRLHREAIVLLNWKKFLESRDVTELYLVEGDPFMALADLDTDCITDVVLVTPADRRVRVLRGEGEGNVAHRAGDELAAFVVGVRGDEPRAVDVVNLSGQTDFPALGIVIAKGGILSDEVAIIVSRGDGVFTELPSISATGTPRAAVAGDFTGNGIPDLVVVGAENFVFLRGLGNAPAWEGGYPQFGTKEPGGPVSIPDVRDYPGRVGIVAADFDRDGNLDIAIGNIGDGTVDIWLGTGDGRFTRGQRLPMADGAQPVALAARDISGNGILDLVVVCQVTEELIVRLGRGDGTFTVIPDTAELVQFAGQQFAVCRIDGECGDDLVRTIFTTRGSLVLGRAARATVYPAEEAPVVFTREEEEVNVHDRVILYRNQVGAEKTAIEVVGTAADPIRMVPERPGVLIANRASEERVTAIPEPGTLVEAWLGSEVDSYEEWQGLVAGNSDSTAFVPRAVLRLEGDNGDYLPYPSAIAVGDVLGDGLDEIIMVDSLGGHVFVLKWFVVEDSRGRVLERTLFDYSLHNSLPRPKHPLPTAAVLAELDPNSPGKEVVIFSARSDSAQVFRLDVDHARTGADQLVPTQIGYGYVGGDSVAAAAVPSQGGTADMIIVADYSADELYLLTRNDTPLPDTERHPLGHVNARILDNTPLRLDEMLGPIDLVAFNDEGRHYVAVAYYDTAQVAILGIEGRSVSISETLQIAGRPYSVAVGDLDGDGMQDVAVVSSAGLEVFFGSGDLAFERCLFRTPEQLGGMPLWVGVGDFNCDGYDDLVVPLGRIDGHGLAESQLAYDDVWGKFGPIERECEE